MSGNLIVLSKPLPQEGAFGYLVRLAAENEMTVQSLFDCLGIAPEKLYSRGLAEEHAKKLSAAMECDERVFRGLFHFPALAIHDKSVRGKAEAPPDDYSRYGMFVAVTEKERTFISLGRPKICAWCVRENGFWSKEWDFTAVTTCLKHGVVLQDYCFHCGNDLTWDNVSLNECKRCGSPYASAKQKRIEVDSTCTELALWLFNRKGGHHPADLQEVLVSRLDFESFTNLFVSLGAAFTNQQGVGFSRLKPWRVPNLSHAYISQFIRNFFQEWPRGPVKGLSDFVRGFAIGSGSASHVLPLKPLLDGIHGFPMDSSLRQTLETAMIDTYCRYLSEGNNLDVAADRIVFPLPSMRNMKKSEVVEFLNVSDAVFNFLLSNGSLQPPVGLAADGVLSFDSVNATRRVLQRILTISEAAQILGISDHNCMHLLKWGVVNTWRSPLAGTGDAHLIQAEELQSFLSSLEAVGSKQSVGSDDSLTLVEALTGLVTASGLGLVDLIEQFKNGSLIPSKVDPDQAGLKKYRFQRSDLMALVSPAPRPHGKHSVSEIAERMGVYSDLVRSLIREGYLGNVVRDTRHSEFLVDTVAVEDFERKFVTISELGKRWDLSVQNLGDRLAGLGINPVAGPGVDGVLVRIYSRQEVEHLDRKAVASMKVTVSSGGRPKSGTRSRVAELTDGLLSASQVCQRLGCSSQELTGLVTAGELQSVRPAGIGGQKRYFEPSEVDSYLRRFRKNTGLVPLELALVELGAVRLSDLHRRWIARKLLTPIDSGLGLYFASTEVEVCKSEACRWLTSKEAAAVLSVTQHQLRNWVKLGRISPVSGPQIDGGRVFLFDKADVEKLLEVAHAG